MDKVAVIQGILAELQTQLELAKGASLEAAEYATHEESKADSKWDTQGLEASYLAAGQAAQVLEIGKSIQAFKQHLESASQKTLRVESGSLFQVSMNGGSFWFFLSSVAGGVSLTTEKGVVTVITAGSPIAHRVVGCAVGDRFRLPNQTEAIVLQLY